MRGASSACFLIFSPLASGRASFSPPWYGNSRHSRRFVQTGQPRCTTPHSSPPNQCLPTHTPRPFIKFLKAIQLHKNRNPQREREDGVAAPSFALSCGKRSTRARRQTVYRRGNSWGSKTYLSTQRCPRVEVVGYPQHPQDGKTQQYPGFPPHSCRVGLVQPSACFVVPL